MPIFQPGSWPRFFSLPRRLLVSIVSVITSAHPWPWRRWAKTAWISWLRSNRLRTRNQEVLYLIPFDGFKTGNSRCSPEIINTQIAATKTRKPWNCVDLIATIHIESTYMINEIAVAIVFDLIHDVLPIFMCFTINKWHPDPVWSCRQTSPQSRAFPSAGHTSSVVSELDSRHGPWPPGPVDGRWWLD